MGPQLLLVLAAACLSVQASPYDPLPYRNTIFADEQLEGEIFENVDAFNGITLYLEDDNPYRLPTTTKPVHYDLEWTTEIPKMYFSGKVDIHLHATQTGVNEIVIHCHDMNITSLALFLGEKEVEVQEFTFQPEYHFLKIRILNGVLNYDPVERILYKLSIEFEAPMRTDMTATAARFAFPCYDEPNLKATFDVTIRRPVGYKSWFCTRLDKTTPSTLSGYEDDIYYVTPIMPTYLLAIIVAEYKSKPLTSSEGHILYEVIARPYAIDNKQGDYAFEFGQKLLKQMSAHTDYDFYAQHKYLKMTQAAIPDFRAGAMEDWGLLLYREAYLMYDESQSSGYYKQVIAYILAHEIAHMWFGNLVTCDWWDNFWLNEGFARYYQYFLTDSVDKELGLGIRFINEQVHTTLLFDSSNNPHPLTNPGVGSPVAIRTMFSTISYGKGACVIRMTEHLLGSDVYREGIRSYLVSRQFSTAEPVHLFEALQNAAEAANAISQYGPDFNVNDYYMTWTKQAGHPLLKVQVDYQKGEMTITQSRFNINTGTTTALTNWFIPITFATASNPDFTDTKPTHIMKEAVTTIKLPASGEQWVIFNKQQTGFYRVLYDDYTWDLLITALRGSQAKLIHEFNKAQIIDDAFQFARSGIMSYNRAFNIISFVENEIDYTPWLATITGLNWIRGRLGGSDYKADFENMIMEWTKPAMTSLGYVKSTGDSFMRSYLRYQMAQFVCNLGLPACGDAAVAQFQELKNGKEVDVDSRIWVYCNALRRGNQDDFEFLWNRYKTHNVYTEKILLLQVLGCTTDRSSLYKFLDAIVQDNYIVRPQDYTTAFSSAVTGNDGNVQIVFDYIKENLETVTLAFGTPETPLSYISSRLRTTAHIDEFQKWADDNRAELGASYQTVRNGAESARSILAWADRVKDDIMTYVRNGQQEIQPTTPEPEEETEPPSTETPGTLLPGTTPALLPETTPGQLPETTPEQLPESTPAPDSATSVSLSALTVVLALLANFA